MAEGIAAGEGVAVHRPRVGAEAKVGEGTVVAVTLQEPVQPGVIQAKAHVVLLRAGIEPVGVEPVGVEDVLGRIGRVGLVDAGEGVLVVVAVGAVAVGRLGVAGLVGHLVDIGVGVVAEVAVLGRPVAVVFDLGQPLTPGGVLIGLGELTRDLLRQDVARYPEVVEVGGLLAGGPGVLGLAGAAVQRVVGEPGGGGRGAGLVELGDRGHALEAVVGVALHQLVLGDD